MTSTLEWLECSRCHVAYDTAAPTNLCRCGGVLLARYRLDDMLDLLEEKTKGNLAKDETETLDGVLHQLRMAFVMTRKEPEPQKKPSKKRSVF